MRLILALTACLALAGSIAEARQATFAASRPATQPASIASPANLAAIIRTLEDEARASKVSGSLVRATPSIARETQGPPPAPASLREKITRRADSDPFIDAYVRWQLTSFEPEIDTAALTESEFRRLMTSLPQCVPNPRATREVIDVAQRATQAGLLKESQQAEFNGWLNMLATRFSAARACSLPAVGLREWFIERFAAQPARVLELRIDLAYEMAMAGWPIEEVKAAIERDAEEAGASRAFSDDQRRAFVRSLERRITGPRMYLADAGVSEAAVTVNFATTGIHDYDIQRWAKAVLRER